MQGPFGPDEHARRFRISNEAYENGLIERARSTLTSVAAKVATEDVRLEGEMGSRALVMLFHSVKNGQRYGWRVPVWPAPSPDVDRFQYFDVHLVEEFHSTLDDSGKRDHEPREWFDDD